MRIHNKYLISVLTAGLFIFLSWQSCFLQESHLFQGELKRNNINVRTDSTVNSEIICSLNKGDLVYVIKEAHDWYKIILPKTAPAFIKKNLVNLIDEKTAIVSKDNVNIRLLPSEASPILGKLGKEQVMNILEEKGGWYKIEPDNFAFGWVHKKFVNKYTPAVPQPSITINVKLTETAGQNQGNSGITVEGIIKPCGKVIGSAASHKLITADNQVYLLKGNKTALNLLNYHKARINGNLPDSAKERLPLIEINSAEPLD